MDRIADQFARAQKENRACFVAYVCAGDPDLDTSLEICRALIDGGIDILELGVPFSDPLADGQTNQLAAQRALESGMTADRVFELVQRIRDFSQIPIVFYTYYNLVFSNGIELYVTRALEAGVDGMLTLDLPPEEAGEALEVCRRLGMKNVFIVAPTTPEGRIGKIAEAASGFIYYVSRVGVTGVRDDLEGDIAEAVVRIKKQTSLPVVVGFGISNRDQVRQIAAMSDGVVVGSALVNCVRDHLGDSQGIVAAVDAKVRELVAGVHR
jgi:tryptophan synthase alpha chain